MIRKITGLTSLVGLTLVFCACSSDEDNNPGKDGKDGRDGASSTPCTVKKDPEGTTKIECPDGSSVDIVSSKAGKPGSPGQAGKEGAPGQPGAEGKDGEPGKSCSVECADEQTMRLFCEDGSEVVQLVDSCTTTGGPLAVLIEETSFAGALEDPTNPSLSLRLRSGGVAMEELELTVSSSDETVITPAQITFTGEGRERLVSFQPQGVGVSQLTFTVKTSAGDKATAQLNYAVSTTLGDESIRYYHHASDASTAIDVGDGYLLLASDNENRIYLYKADESGPPIKFWDFSGENQLGAESVQMEASARRGSVIVWVGAHAEEPSRVVFGTLIAGNGAEVELTFAGHYGGGTGTPEERAARGLWPELVALDQDDSYSGTQFAQGMQVEGFEFSNGIHSNDHPNTTGFLAFRNPIFINPYNPRAAKTALIVPLDNILELTDGSGGQSDRASFAQFPTTLNIDSRSIRELRRNAAGEFLILASPPDKPEYIVEDRNNSWALFTWNGSGTAHPLLNRTLPDPAPGGAWEAIASMPEKLLPGEKVRLIADSGDMDFYGTGKNRDLAPGHRKSYSQEFELE